MKSCIILDEKLVNKDRKFGSQLEYYPAFVKETGAPLLFTENEIKVAQLRAERNVEDVQKPSSSFFDFLFCENKK